jgi:sec-independent protein translocase protein TatA
LPILEPMFGIGIPELLIILVIVIVIFGASRLPQIGEGLGKGIKNFRGALREPPEIDVTPPKENPNSTEAPKPKS